MPKNLIGRALEYLDDSPAEVASAKSVHGDAGQIIDKEPAVAVMVALVVLSCGVGMEGGMKSVE